MDVTFSFWDTEVHTASVSGWNAMITASKLHEGNFCKAFGDKFSVSKSLNRM